MTNDYFYQDAPGLIALQVSKTKDKLFKYQEDLERQQREEEDRLMAQFHEERVLEAENMKKEFESEWEMQLQDLTAVYEGTQKKKDKTVSIVIVMKVNLM